MKVVGVHDLVGRGDDQHLRIPGRHLFCSGPVSVDGGLDLLLPSTPHRWDDQRRNTAIRRRFAPIGWPRRDPRHYRFAVPNAVWEYKLKPVEFVIVSCLCYHRAPGALTPGMIAADIHITTGTVKKYLTTLVTKEIVSEDGTPALKYKDKKFFTLPNEVFLLRLLPSVFMVYAYLLLVEDRRTHTCHPSYNTIAAATRISKNTAMKSISTLLEMGLITVEPSSYFDKCGMKWKGNNLYTIQPIRPAVDADYLRKLRADSVKNVKATNGLLTFEQKAREREESAEGDDQ